MTLCVESYIGEDGGDEGVKLEQQLLITEDEPELLSSFPFEARRDCSASRPSHGPPNLIRNDASEPRDPLCVS
jgi:Xaa-Pro dipeptidase